MLKWQAEVTTGEWGGDGGGNKSTMFFSTVVALNPLKLFGWWFTLKFYWQNLHSAVLQFNVHSAGISLSGFVQICVFVASQWLAVCCQVESIRFLKERDISTGTKFRFQMQGRVSHSAQVGLCSSHPVLPNSHSPNGNTEASKCDGLQQFQGSQGSFLAHSVISCQTEPLTLKWCNPGAARLFFRKL